MVNQKIATLRDWIDEVEAMVQEARVEDGKRPDNQEGMPDHHFRIAGILTPIVTKVEGPVANAVANLASSIASLKKQAMNSAKSWTRDLGHGVPMYNSNGERTEPEEMTGGKRRSTKNKSKKTRKTRRSL